MYPLSQGRRWVESFFLDQMIAVIKPLAPSGTGSGARTQSQQVVVPVKAAAANTVKAVPSEAASGAAGEADPVVEVRLGGVLLKGPPLRE